MKIGKTRTNQPVEKTAGLDEESVSQATELVEGGTLDNAKPIYCHPITLQFTSGTYNLTKLIILIFNNSQTALTATTFLSLINSFVGRISVNGYLVKEEKTYITTFISPQRNLLGLASDMTYISEPISDILADVNLVFNDDVNKIN